MSMVSKLTVDFLIARNIRMFWYPDEADAIFQQVSLENCFTFQHQPGADLLCTAWMTALLSEQILIFCPIWGLDSSSSPQDKITNISAWKTLQQVACCPRAVCLLIWPDFVHPSVNQQDLSFIIGGALSLSQFWWPRKTTLICSYCSWTLKALLRNLSKLLLFLGFFGITS